MQENGFEAIRAVYGGAVPNPHEFDRVEYVRALHTEGSRYYVPVRLGFPRVTVSDSTYNGVTIPTGTASIFDLKNANGTDSYRKACDREQLCVQQGPSCL
jgi:cytochrome P450